MANKFLNQPPLQTDILSTNVKTKLNEYWSRWIDDLHYLLSDRSFQTINSARPINVNAKYVALDSSGGGFAITLDAPNRPTVPLMIECTNYGGNITMSLSNCEGGTASTTCTWNSVNDTLILESRSDKWIITKQQGVTLV